MPRKPRRPLDPAQSAASIFVSVMATDEEFATGVHLKNPKAILDPIGSKKAVKKKPKGK